MTTYHVTANMCDFGLIAASSSQEARDEAAKMAGYQSEADMEQQLEAHSEIECIPVRWDADSGQWV